MKKIKKTILSILILGPALLAFAQRSDLQEDYATKRKGNILISREKQTKNYFILFFLYMEYFDFTNFFFHYVI